MFSTVKFVYPTLGPIFVVYSTLWSELIVNICVPRPMAAYDTYVNHYMWLYTVEIVFISEGLA